MTQRRKPADADDSTPYSTKLMQAGDFEQSYEVYFNMKSIGGKNGRGTLNSINLNTAYVSISNADTYITNQVRTSGFDISAPLRSAQHLFLLDSPTETTTVRVVQKYDMYVYPRIPLGTQTRFGTQISTGTAVSDIVIESTKQITTSGYINGSIGIFQGQQDFKQYLTYYTGPKSPSQQFPANREATIALPMYGRGTLSARFYSENGGLPSAEFNNTSQIFTKKYLDISWDSVVYTQR